VFFVLLVSACSADTEVIYDPCSPLVVEPGPGSLPNELQSIEDAIAAWNEVLPTRLELSSGSSEDALPILFDSGDTYYRALYWDKRGEIWIGRDKLSADDLALAIAHEMGHAFGLQHVDAEDRPSVMNVGNLEFSPSVADADAVRDVWDSCR
jgi:hypothetical protein